MINMFWEAIQPWGCSPLRELMIWKLVLNGHKQYLVKQRVVHVSTNSCFSRGSLPLTCNYKDVSLPMPSVAPFIQKSNPGCHP